MMPDSFDSSRSMESYGMFSLKERAKSNQGIESISLKDERFKSLWNRIQRTKQRSRLLIPIATVSTYNSLVQIRESLHTEALLHKTLSHTFFILLYQLIDPRERSRETVKKP